MYSAISDFCSHTRDSNKFHDLFKILYDFKYYTCMYSLLKIFLTGENFCLDLMSMRTESTACNFTHVLFRKNCHRVLLALYISNFTYPKLSAYIL